MTDPRQVTAENLAAVNAHDPQRIRATYAENAVLEAPGPARFEGADAITEYVMVWLRAFPDAHQTIVNEFVVGDSVVAEFTLTGTHTGALAAPDGDIPPTNRKARGRGMGIQRIENGTIVEERIYFDQLEILSQLDVVPQPATA